MNKYTSRCKKGILSLLLTIILGTIILSTPAVGGADDLYIRVYVDPPVIWDPDMTPGTQFSVDICVENVENLWGYKTWLKFNPAVIHGVSYENGPFIGKDTDPRKHPVIFAAGAGFDNVAGELKLFGAFLKFTGVPPHDRYLADGSGVLATITFEVVGYGSSPITLGAPDTALTNKHAEFELCNTVNGEEEYCYGQIWVPSPGGGGEWKPYEPWLNSMGHGSFANEPGPRLYIRTKGAHGTTGIWPEWKVGLSNWTQTLYCRILNYGFMGAWVEVEFVIRSEQNGMRIMSDQVWVDPAIDKGEPSEVTVSVSFNPVIVGKYWAYGILYFKAGCMTEKVPYYLFQESFGGEGISRDLPQAFKIQEQI